MKVGATGRLALCSQNAHDQNVLVWDKARLSAVGLGWVRILRAVDPICLPLQGRRGQTRKNNV